MRVTTFVASTVFATSFCFADNMPVYHIDKFGFMNANSANEVASGDCAQIIDNALNGAIKIDQQMIFLDCLAPKSAASTGTDYPFEKEWGADLKPYWNGGGGSNAPVPWAFEKIPG